MAPQEREEGKKKNQTKALEKFLVKQNFFF
jgi:hypothetical protein